ncbi:hypothetical protein EDD16DRAFT_1529416 [Pisolithus croceorrhizus]|nr:hypothetical protein EDD16DRAFT_1529416 [Pisolithus croceorrhizus]KAI6122953.1 hypothetical protein EV401DRAFT_1887008 [Pisolithus croceorrhizus]KAI6148198.1 hypothetical protein EDD17DRAFT_1514255 [Pisolithus thermaeus]
MPSAIKSITPFYNNDSVAPPPFPTMLTDQLELFGRTSNLKSSGLLTDEVLTLAHMLSLKKACSASSTPSNSSEEERAGSSDDESTSSMQSAEALKIPNPPGEPGHPRRGGYTLETALDWNQKAYSKFKKHMHALINEHLDTMKCLSVQDPALLKVVHQKAVDKFLDLEDYSNCWPYTSSHMRWQETKMAAGKKKKAKTPSQLMGHMGQAWVHMMNGSVHEAQYMTHL